MEFEEEPTSNIVLNEKNEYALKASMQSQRDRGSLVLFFHGRPGTGKFTTAHYLAEDAKLPILSLRLEKLRTGVVGDLGSRLHKAFGLADRWGCMVLLDDAHSYLLEGLVQTSEANALVPGTSQHRLLRAFEGLR